MEAILGFSALGLLIGLIVYNVVMGWGTLDKSKSELVDNFGNTLGINMVVVIVIVMFLFLGGMIDSGDIESDLILKHKIEMMGVNNAWKAAILDSTLHYTTHTQVLTNEKGDTLDILIERDVTYDE